MPLSNTANTRTGWRADLELGFHSDGSRTRLRHYRHQGPLLVQKPFYPEIDGTCHIYLLHPPGGVVGGDELRVHIELDTGAQALVTTPAAGKFYRSLGATARQTQHLQVAEGACLEWLPQETIVFENAQVDTRTYVELHGDARFIGWEVVCLGRPAADERFLQGQFRQRLEIRRAGLPLYWEKGLYAGELLRASWGLGGRPVFANLYCTPPAPGGLEAARAALPTAQGEELFGLTQVDDVLIGRYAGDSTERAKRIMSRVWQVLRAAVLGKDAIPPRVWSA
ncbi:MAG: urease accessory protein UreD [Gammaproteobacteria bacterium]|nr:urease accessory protein UreD [Gammaproteobacteria bacterium]MCP5425477.1 urease accessory protein UreD [Gammaproteobacteria bacterium]MCP5459920.1 urease accessory protein UreD [Gammaproteobacteria bacterium]